MADTITSHDVPAVLSSARPVPSPRSVASTSSVDDEQGLIDECSATRQLPAAHKNSPVPSPRRSAPHPVPSPRSPSIQKSAVIGSCDEYDYMDNISSMQAAGGSFNENDYFVPPQPQPIAVAAFVEDEDGYMRSTVQESELDPNDNDYEVFRQPSPSKKISVPPPPRPARTPECTFKRPNLSRPEAENLLRNEPVGTYILRAADTDKFIKITVKTASNSISHHIIKLTDHGCTVNVRAYPGITDLTSLLAKLSRTGAGDRLPWDGSALERIHPVCL